MMNTRSFLIGLVLILLFFWATSIVFADQTELPPPPPMHPMMGPTGICGDEQYLYVMAGGKILQYAITEMKLLTTVDLPKPVPPSSEVSQESKAFQFPPPPHRMGGPHGLWLGDGFLYILAGPFIYRYTSPDLTLQTTLELPKPEIPQAAK